MTRRDTESRRGLFCLSLETALVGILAVKLFLGAGMLVNLSRETPLLTPQTALAAEQETVDAKKIPARTTLPPPENADLTAKYESMLLVLERRQQQLRAQAEMLEEREEGLQTLREQIKLETGRLDELIRQKEALLLKQQGILDEQKKVLAGQAELKDARIEHLVQAYSAMRPESAAKLVDSLDDEVAVRIFSSMNGRTAGKIMAFVEPAKAARLTKQLSTVKPADKRDVPPAEK